MRIPITKPFFGDEELRAVQQPLENGWVVQGPFVKQFEDQFSRFTGTVHSIATTSCTTALHLALAALGVKPGDEVIVPAFTWISTANVVEYMGARPVFCDINLETYNIDEAAITALITPRTVGIIPVHLFGLCAHMDAIQSIAARHHLWIVEDAACALGAWYGCRHAGTFGNAGCFSFHPRKSITTGEGGMITTADASLAAAASSLRDHGATRSDLHRHNADNAFLLAEYPHLGFNYRMTDIQGALGCAQMTRVGALLAARARLAHAYDEALEGVRCLRLPAVPDGYTHGYQAYVTLFAPDAPQPENVERLGRMRNDVMRTLESAGIATRQGTHAPILTEYYARKYALRPESYPNAWAADRLTLALPLYPQMTPEEQRAVCDAVTASCAAS